MKKTLEHYIKWKNTRSSVFLAEYKKYVLRGY